MVSDKALSDSGWKDLCAKNKLKDNGVSKALADIRRHADGDHDAALDSYAALIKVVAQTKKSKEVAAAPAVGKYLAEMASAAEAAQKAAAKAKADADKKGESDAQAKKREAAKKGDEEGEEEEPISDLLTTKMIPLLRDLNKGNHTMHVLVASAGKQVAVLMSRKPISPAKRKLLAEELGVSGGIKYIVGHCLKEEGMTTFALKTQVAGMAKRLKVALLQQTGLRVKVRCRGEDGETDDDLDEQGQGQSGDPIGADQEAQGDAGAAAAPKTQPFEIGASVGRGGKNLEADVRAVQSAINRRLGLGLKVDGHCGAATLAAISEFQQALGQSRPDGLVEPKRGTARALLASGKLAKAPPPPEAKALPADLGAHTLDRAPLVWQGARGIVDHNIEAVKKCVRQEYANEHPTVLAEIDRHVQKVDVIMDKLDTRLSDALDRARSEKDPARRKTELAGAKTILADYIAFVKSEPLIDHLDNNPFGIRPQVRKTITDSLTHVIRSIG